MFQLGVWIVECKGVGGAEEKGEEWECAVESEKGRRVGSVTGKCGLHTSCLGTGSQTLCCTLGVEKEKVCLHPEHSATRYQVRRLKGLLHPGCREELSQTCSSLCETDYPGVYSSCTPV